MNTSVNVADDIPRHHPALVAHRQKRNENLQLRIADAITTFADNSRHASPWAADIYRRAIERGCDHPHAVRILARAWIRVIWRCWMDRVPYDPAKHGAFGRAVGSGLPIVTKAGAFGGRFALLRARDLLTRKAACNLR